MPLLKPRRDKERMSYLEQVKEYMIVRASRGKLKWFGVHHHHHHSAVAMMAAIGAAAAS